jgi:transcriptional regulator with XRE-family HTH domain
MLTRDTLLERIHAYRARHGISERRFSMRVSGHSNVIARVRQGQATLRTIEAIERVLAESERSLTPDPWEPPLETDVTA